MNSIIGLGLVVLSIAVPVGISGATQAVRVRLDCGPPPLDPETIQGTWEAIDFRTQRVLRLVVGKLQDGRAALSAPGVERPLIFGPVHFSIHGKNIFISAPGISEPNSSLRIRVTGVGQMGGGYIQGTVTIKLPAPRGAADVWNNVTLAMLPGGAVFAVYDEAKKAAEALSNDARAAEHGVAPDERAPAAPARR